MLGFENHEINIASPKATKYLDKLHQLNRFSFVKSVLMCFIFLLSKQINRLKLPVQNNANEMTVTRKRDQNPKMKPHMKP